MIIKIFFVFIFVVLVLCGVLTLVSGKTILGSSKETGQYKPSSIKSYNKISGIIYIAGGVFFGIWAVYQIFFPAVALLQYIAWCGIGVCAAALLITYLTVLRR